MSTKMLGVVGWVLGTAKFYPSYPNYPNCPNYPNYPNFLGMFQTKVNISNMIKVIQSAQSQNETAPGFHQSSGLLSEGSESADFGGQS